MCAHKTGVELELWVVASDGALADGSTIAAAHERIEQEFIDPLIEIQTEPHEDEVALRDDLWQTLRAAVRAAEMENKRLVPLGTPLTSSEAAVNCRRGELFEAIYGSGVQSAKNCAGSHIHFEKGAVVDQLNVLTAIDPALALVSSSPYYAGENGQYSARARAYRKDCGEPFQQFCDLWPYTTSLGDWRARVDSAYEQFQTLALNRGVAPETVRDCFDPADTVLNPVRLRHSQPTVEWRAPDAALPNEVLDLALAVRTLVSKTESRPVAVGNPGLHSDRIGLPEFSALRRLSGQAIREGLESSDVTTYLRKLGFRPDSFDPVAPKIDGSRTITEPEARRVRLEQADRLERDLTAIPA